MSSHPLIYKRVKRFCLSLFITYICVVLYATLFTYNYYTYGRSVNLVAFDSIKLMWRSGNQWLILKNVFGNVLLFIPLGFFLPLMLKKLRKLGLVFSISFLSSLSIESCQYIFAQRIFDVDDIILNTLGGVIGWVIFIVIYGIYQLIKRNIKF